MCVCVGKHLAGGGGELQSSKDPENDLEYEIRCGVRDGDTVLAS